MNAIFFIMIDNYYFQWRIQDFSTGGGGGGGQSAEEEATEIVLIRVSKWHFLHIKCNCRVGLRS